jgi:protoporphyrinogen oxidase
MKVGIVGGGIMGISLGYFLSKAGVNVEIFEASPILGGLAGPIHLDDGTAIDRFYHAILSSDNHLLALCDELGIADQLRFNETKMGFYHDQQIYSMNNMVEFFRFPPLGWIDRFRLGINVLYAQFVRDWHQLEGISVEEWLVRWSGRHTYENIWRPLLKAKFDGNFSETPATYIWSRLVRMKSTRSGASQKEESGHLIGGYITLIKAMVAQIEASGGKIHLRCPVQRVRIEKGKATALQLVDNVKPFDSITVTMQLPIFQRLIPDAGQEYHRYLDQTEYLGVIAPVLILDRPLTDYWTLNITDDHIPFTGIIETTTYIDPKYVGGHHLVYLPKYTSPGSRWSKMPDEEIRKRWLEHLVMMFPNFERDWIRYFLIHRERFVEPLHLLNGTHLIPEVRTPVENLYLATTAQIYPGLTNGESVTKHAKKAAAIIISR